MHAGVDSCRAGSGTIRSGASSTGRTSEIECLSIISSHVSSTSLICSS